MGKTLFEKVWDTHVVAQDPGAPAILYIDAHLIHEVTSPQAFSMLRERGLQVRRPDKTFATMDHAIPTRIGVDISLWPVDAATQVRTLRENCAEFGITLWDIEGEVQGIVHVVGPEMGVTQPERKSSFMELRCGMEDEKLAASLLTTHLETIEEDYKKKQTKKSREMYELLNSRADSLLRVLNGTENRLARYTDQNQQVVVAQGQLMQTKLTRNSTFLTQLYYAAMQQADNMRLSLIREAPLFNIIDPVAFPLYKEVKAPVGMRIGIALGLLLSIIAIFLRETYRSIMREE